MMPGSPVDAGNRTSAPGRLARMSRPATLGQLRESGWESVPVKEEIRRNAIAKIAAGEPLFPGVLGYEDTVLPQLENALLAGHDVIFLGERGQAKTRMIRSLDRPARRVDADRRRLRDQRRPVRSRCRSTPATWSREHGDDTPIDWVHRDTRFGEKLATPDTSIADLIGEVDPIKVAEGRYLSDELTLHYGLVPRTNRGIFAINELPDLAERIQVGLLNVLEERDVQVRGYKIRLPLDVLLVASANPEDYTNRGRIITPLKDRFGARSARTTRSRSRPRSRSRAGGRAPLDAPGIRVSRARVHGRDRGHALPPGPPEPAHQPAVRRVGAPHGVQLGDARRPTRPRRALRHGENEVVPRVSDLEALASSTSGKVEIEALEEGRDEQIVEHLLRGAVLTVFKERVGTEVGARRHRRVRRRHRRPRRRRRRRRPTRRSSCPTSRRLREPVRALDRWRRVARRGRQRRRVRARGPAPVQAPQQGRRRARATYRPAANRPARPRTFA